MALVYKVRIRHWLSFVIGNYRPIPLKNSVEGAGRSWLHHQWRPVLKALGARYRPPYNCRHTYATICLMSGMNPAFISQQLGHSVQMLLPTYARWINSSSDWSELEKLKIGIELVSGAPDHS